MFIKVGGFMWVRKSWIFERSWWIERCGIRSMWYILLRVSEK